MAALRWLTPAKNSSGGALRAASHPHQLVEVDAGARARATQSRTITAPARGYPLVLLAVSLTVAAYTMRLSSNTLYVNALRATQV
jgi:hypothetical protein